MTQFLRNIILGKWGHVEADGTWSGLVRHAKDGIVDFVICDVFLTYSRAQVWYCYEVLYNLHFSLYIVRIRQNKANNVSF